MNIPLNQLAKKIGAELRGDPAAIATGVSPLDNIAPGHIAYLERQKDAPLLDGKHPAAVICSRAVKLENHNLLISDRPKIAFIETLKHFSPASKPAPGAHPSASVHPEASVHPTASIGACAVVDKGAAVGAGTTVMPCAYVGENAVIGENCVLHPQSAVLARCVLGDRVILHSGVVIGADGFGYERAGDEHIKVPQIGTAVIEDDVEIGANSAIDRATLGETRVCIGAKIDNLVQIGHNCRIGKAVVICGQAGIAGSSEIGDLATLAGQAGISDHIKIGPGAIIGGQSGVITDIPPGKLYSGMPAAPHRDTMRILSALSRLPELEKQLAALKKELDSLVKKNDA